MRAASRPMLTVVLPLTLILLVPILSPKAFAGPPYITDDPEPVEYQHWEVYSHRYSPNSRMPGAARLPTSK